MTCDDGETRPIIRIGVVASSGQAIHADFLVDLGADRTVLDQVLLSQLQLPHQSPPPGLTFQGVGGASPFVVVATVLELPRDDGGIARASGQFAAFTDPRATDLSILGRDVLNHFDILVSRRLNQVVLLAGNHRYAILTDGPAG